MGMIAESNSKAAIAIVLSLVLAAGGCSRTQVTPFEVNLVPSPAPPGSAQPHLARSPSGALVLSWQQRVDDDATLNYAVWQEQGWSAAAQIARGADWFVNWADFSSVVPVTDSLWAAHWLVKRPGGTYAYDIAMALSRDGGVTWDAPFKPHSDGTPTEHGFVTLYAAAGGVGALWLDGRNMQADGDAGLTMGHGSQGMTLRSASFDADGGQTREDLVDALVCDCCQTDVAVTDAGAIAVYRNRTEEEVRDIYVTRNDGSGWTSPRPVADDGWHIAGCPVNGPAVAASGDVAVVAWFTAANGDARVRYARSDDGAARFASPIDVDTGNVVGRVDIELLADGRSVVSWLRKSADGTAGELCARTIAPDGATGETRVIARLATARASGFPQMMVDDDRLVFAWTQSSADDTRVVTAVVNDVARSFQR